MGIRTPILDQWGLAPNANVYGYNTAGTGTNDSPATPGVTHNWTTPGNITTTVTGNAALTTNGAGPFVLPYLRASNFGFNVPSSGTITGVELFVEVGASVTDYISSEVKLAFGGTPTLSAGNKNTGTFFTSNVDLTFGADADLWGESTASLTPAVINATDFGAVLKFTRSTTATTRTINIISMSMAVYFTGSDGEARVTQNFAEVIYSEGAGEVRVTQASSEVIYSVAVPVTYPAGRRQFVIRGT